MKLPSLIAGSASKFSRLPNKFERLPNKFTRSSNLIPIVPVGGVIKGTVLVRISTTAAASITATRSATAGVTINASAKGHFTYFAIADVTISATAAGKRTAGGTANIGVDITASADGEKIGTTHSSSTADCQVNISASARGFNPNTAVPDETSNGNTLYIYNHTNTPVSSFVTDAAIGTRSTEFLGNNTISGTGYYGIIDDTFESTFQSSFSISVWVKFHSQGPNNNWILGNTKRGGDGGDNDKVALWFQSGVPRFWYKAGGVSKFTDASNYTSNTDWTHVVATYDSSSDTTTLYLDGSSEATNTTSIDPTDYTNTTKMRVSVFEDEGNNVIYTRKKIDDISIWSKALTSTEVSSLYNSGNGTNLTGSSDLVGWWKMGDHSVVATTHSGTATVSVDVTASASGDTFTTHSGTASCQVNVSASASGSAFTAFTNNYSIELDGLDDHIDADNFNPSTQIGTGAFTMSMWMKTDSTSNQIFWYMGDSTTNNMMRMNYLASSGGFKIWATSGGTWTNQYPHVNISTSTDTWYHVAVVRSGTTVTLYVNGTNSDSKTHSSLGTGFGTQHWLGRYYDGSNRLDGHIDEYAFWDEALTSSEIEAIYNSGAPFDLTSDSGNYASSANLIGYWRFEDNTVSGSGGHITDSSTNSNTLQLFNGPIFSTDVPVFNQFSISLDGLNDYIDLGNPSALQITGDMSIGMWFKTSSGSENRLIAKDGGGGQPRQYVLLLLNNKLRWVRFNSSGTLFTIDSVDTYNDNAWHHVVVTNKSTGTIDMFVDGVQLTEGTGSGNYTVETTNGDDGITMNNASVDIEIGYFAQANSQYFSGLIDEVAIWNDALSASEVTKIYNSGSPIDIGSNDGNYTSSANLQGWWRFEENTGLSITDSSSNSNSATLVNGPTFSTTTPS